MKLLEHGRSLAQISSVMLYEIKLKLARLKNDEKLKFNLVFLSDFLTVLCRKAGGSGNFQH